MKLAMKYAAVGWSPWSDRARPRGLTSLADYAKIHAWLRVSLSGMWLCRHGSCGLMDIRSLLLHMVLLCMRGCSYDTHMVCWASLRELTPIYCETDSPSHMGSSHPALTFCQQRNDIRVFSLNCTPICRVVCWCSVPHIHLVHTLKLTSTSPNPVPVRCGTGTAVSTDAPPECVSAAERSMPSPAAQQPIGGVVPASSTAKRRSLHFADPVMTFRSFLRAGQQNWSRVKHRPSAAAGREHDRPQATDQDLCLTLTCG